MRRALLLLALVAAGCGGAQRSALGGGAALLPANTVSFVAARPSDQGWRDFARTVLQRATPRVPRDADEIDLAVLQDGKLVVLAHAHGAWSGVQQHAKPSLAQSANYQASLRALPANAIAQGYVRGDVTRQRLVALPGQTVTTAAAFGSRFRVVAHPVNVASNAVLEFRWTAAWLTKNGLGIRAHSAGLPIAKSENVRTVEQLAPAYAPALFDEIPADALAVLDVPLAPGSFELLPHLPEQLTRLFAPRGRADLATALDAILQGETAVYLRRGGELTIVTSPPDLAAAEDALVEVGPIRGRPFRRAEIGGQLVLSTSAAGIAAFRGGGAKLSADHAFRAAGFPQQVSGLAYVTPAGARLLHTRALSAYSSPDGEDPTFTVRYGDPSR